jgi:hypothetical protein
MMRIINAFVLATLSLFLLSGCASIVSKSKYPVSISSNPEGADIAIANGIGKTVYSGKTPTTVTLKAGAGYFKGETYTVTFKREGYATHKAQIERGVDGWYIAGNIFIGGLLGWLVVDPITGAMWTLKDLHVNLKPEESYLQKEGLHIVTIDNVPNYLRSKMTKIK